MKKIVAIKVYQQKPYWKNFDRTSIMVSQYLYCVYFFGFLVHSVMIDAMIYTDAEKLFSGKIINYQKNENETTN